MDASQFASAYALSATVGLRPFLVLGLAALAVHFGYLHPSHQFAWLGEGGVALVLGALAVLELGADKIPALDNAAHVVHFATKPVAAAILVGSLIPDASIGADGGLSTANYALMALGALNALGVHSATAAVRAASTATTGGVANPFLSLFEDGMTVAGVILAVVMPFVAAAAVLLACAVAVWLVRRVWTTARRPVRTSRA